MLSLRGSCAASGEAARAGEGWEELALASLRWAGDAPIATRAGAGVGTSAEGIFLRRISARLELFSISTLWATATFFPAS